jgi:predicted ribosome quality control (RQC) complex YloA/Tae2 family protein
MDRFFLAALVREIAPYVVGKRSRGLSLWTPAGFVIPLNMKDESGLVFSLAPEAPGFYLGTPPLPLTHAKSRERLTRLLTGSQLVQIRSAKLDRVVHLEWRRRKPSGVELELELIVEWLGTRNAAYLIDKQSREVLDRIAHGAPRWSRGQTFEPAEPPPGVGPLASDGADFLERLDEALEKGLGRKQAVREASGLSPLLADELLYLHSERGIAFPQAFESVRDRLKSPGAVVYHPLGDFRDRTARYRLSPIRLEQWGQGKVCPTLNEGASMLIGLSSRLGLARRRWQELGTALHRRTKKQRELLKKLERDRRGLEDPKQLRRWGELLLAGLTSARRVQGGVEVPDPYHPSADPVRVPLDPRLDLPANAERYFRKSRKVEKGLAKMKTRISEVKNELDYLETLDLMRQNAGGVEELEALAQELHEEGILAEGVEKRKTLAPAPLGPRRFVSSRGAVILAGRSARSNEELTFKIARPEEMWFHAKGSAGAHVVLRRMAASRLEIEEAAGVAAYYSKSRGASYVEVVYTLRKHVRKIPGAPPGTVRLARHQSIRVRPALPPSSVADLPAEGDSSIDFGQDSSDEKD